MSTIRIAAAQYPIDAITSFGDYAEKQRRWVEEAAGAGAKLLVFPEYGAMELAYLAGPDIAADLHLSTARMQEPLQYANLLHADLARDSNVYILAASAPIRRDGVFRNTARLWTPNGGSFAHEKRLMTRFERFWGIEGGGAQSVYATPFGKIGIAVCYDVEFPLVVRALTEAGAEIILSPSCTETDAGYWRVRVGGQARALESQCYVVQSPTVGDALWSPAVDKNVGAAGVYGPPDKGLPSNGVLVEGEYNKAQWLYADLDLELLRRIRSDGEQLNNAHWGEQAPVTPADVIDAR